MHCDTPDGIIYSDMIKIGNVICDNNIFLAPMAGVTDLSFRLICKRWGAGLVYSEMVSAKALSFNDKKTYSLMQSCDEEQPLAIQIFGSEPCIMAESAKKVEAYGAKIIDINMGCPAPKVTSGGDGSALLSDFDLIARIVDAVSSAVSVPVTCKIRCGIKEYIDVAKLCKIIEQNGASAICVHGRTAAMYYSGKADRSIIASAKRAVSIPVIANGDIYTAEDAASMLSQTGCDAIMLGRGAQGNPFLFTQIKELFEYGKVITNPTNTQRLEVMKEQIFLLCSLKGEGRGVREARKHVAWYTKGMRGSSVIRNEVCKTESYESLLSVIDRYINYLSNGDELK